MNLNFHKKCQICGTKYLIKHQAGYRSTEFFFECPECGIMLSGEVVLDPNSTKIEANFQNLIETESQTDSDYFIQLSGEFYDNKLKNYESADTFKPGSFMQNINPKIREMATLSNYLCEDIFKEYENVKTVIELILSNKNNKKYIYSELKKVSSECKSFLSYSENEDDYELEKFDILFKSLLYPFAIIIKLNNDKFNFSYTRERFNIACDKIENVDLLKETFGDTLEEIIKSLSNGLLNYIEILKKINPIVSSETFDVYNIEDIKESKGLNTVDYKHLLKNYADNFEIIGKVLPIYVSIDNIYRRSDINSFLDDEYSSIDKFKKETVGSMLVYIKKMKKPELSYMDYSILNNKIRNSINHYSFQYDSISQLIKFNDRKKTNEKYLLEFAYDNYLLFYLICDSLFIVSSLAKKIK